MRGWPARVRDVLFRSRADTEMDDELRFHIEMETENNIRRGMDEEEARRVALAHFGGLERHRQHLRDGRQAPILEPLYRDLRIGLRAIRRTPGFSLIAIMTVALGVGATSSVFSIADTFLYRPLPLPGTKQLVTVDELRRGAMSSGREGWRIPFSRYRAYAERTDDVFSGLAGHRFVSFAVRLNGRTLPMNGAQTSGNYLQVLGLTPIVGSFYREDDEASAVISHRVWQDHFQSASNVAGSVIRVDSKTLAVVGVAPAGFTGASMVVETDVWTPMGANDADLSPGQWENWVAMIGRLRPGVDIRTAEAATSTVAVAVPPDESQTTVRGTAVAPMTGLPRNARSVVGGFLGMLLGLAALVLLIASANIAGMMMSRTFARRREMAVRLAIGAGRVRIVRHLMAEGLVLFALGGVAGIGLAYAATASLSFVQIPPPVTFDLNVRPDGTVFLFALCVTGLAGVVFSLLPALHASQPDLVSGLKDGGRFGPVAGERLRSIFVGGQVAMATLLLIVASLFARSLQTAMSVDLGFEYEGVVAGATDLGTHGYSVDDGQMFYQRLKEDLRRVAGVESVGLSQHIPLNGARSGTDVHNGVDGEGNRRTNSSINVVDAGFFETVGIQLVAGRGFLDTDARGSPEVTIINETLAERIWPGISPLGRQLSMDGRAVEVIGVTRDGKYTFVSESATAFLWLSLAQNYRGRMSVHARAPGNQTAALQSIQEIARTLDPNVAVEEAKPLTDFVDFSLFPQRFAAGLIGIFGLIGMALSALGVYGVLSFQVAQRTRELGIRRALGATGADLVRQIVRVGAMLSMVGCAVGLMFGGAAARLLGSFLVGLATFDGVTFVGVPLVLIAVALTASAIPALRATTIPATEALREE